MKEHGIQNAIRNELAGSCFCFRANVGQGYTASPKDTLRVDRPMAVSVNKGDVVLRRARRFDTGLPPGFHDLFGWVDVVITPDMVGKTFARFFSLEVKAERGRASAGQTDFRHAVIGSGGASSVVRSVDEAAALIRDTKAGRTWH